MLRYLREHSDLGLWSVSRVEGEDWILLKVDDEAYDVGDNTVLKWRDSFCSRMVQGEGSMFDHDCKESGAYADAPIGRQLQIGAYVGIPLELPDGEVFGTLCGIDPKPRAPFSETLPPGRSKAACETRISSLASAATSSGYWPLHATSNRPRTWLCVFAKLSVSETLPHQRAWRCDGKIGR